MTAPAVRIFVPTLHYVFYTCHEVCSTVIVFNKIFKSQSHH